MTGWRYYQHAANGKEYICPNYYKYSTKYKFYCETEEISYGDDFKEVYNSRMGNKDYFYSAPMFRDEEQLILSRQVMQKNGNDAEPTGDWDDCMEVN